MNWARRCAALPALLARQVSQLLRQVRDGARVAAPPLLLLVACLPLAEGEALLRLRRADPCLLSAYGLPLLSGEASFRTCSCCCRVVRLQVHHPLRCLQVHHPLRCPLPQVRSEDRRSGSCVRQVDLRDACRGHVACAKCWTCPCCRGVTLCPWWSGHGVTLRLRDGGGRCSLVRLLPRLVVRASLLVRAQLWFAALVLTCPQGIDHKRRGLRG